MRKQPAITPPVINTNQYQQARAEQIGTQVREYRLITPPKLIPSQSSAAARFGAIYASGGVPAVVVNLITTSKE
jgi:hypothetical protein